MPKLKKYDIYLQPNTWKQLKIKTAMEGLTNSSKIRQLINDYLNQSDKTANYKTLIDSRVKQGAWETIITIEVLYYVKRETLTPLEELKQYCKEKGYKIKQ